VQRLRLLTHLHWQRAQLRKRLESDSQSFSTLPKYPEDELGDYQVKE
jgi:hypothetical protein